MNSGPRLTLQFWRPLPPSVENITNYTKNNYSSWFATDQADSILQKNALKRRERSSWPPVDWFVFGQCGNKRTQAIRTAKITHFKENFSEELQCLNHTKSNIIACDHFGSCITQTCGTLVIQITPLTSGMLTGHDSSKYNNPRDRFLVLQMCPLG